MAVLLCTAIAYRSVGATTDEPPGDEPEGQPIDCAAENARLRREVMPVLLSGGYERLPEHLKRRVNPFTEHPCGSLFATAPGSVVFTSAQAGSYEPSAIRAVWSEADAAWNARDAQAFSRPFAEDVSFTFVRRGRSLESRAAVLEYFAERFSRLAPDLRLRTRIGAIRAVAPGFLTADGKVEILRAAAGGDGVPEVSRTFAIFAVMSSGDEGWSIRALRIYELPTGDAA